MAKGDIEDGMERGAARARSRARNATDERSVSTVPWGSVREGTRLLSKPPGKHPLSAFDGF